MLDKELNKKELEITIKNDDERDKEVVIPLSAIFQSLKRFAVCWLALAVLAALLVAAGTSIFSHQLSSAPVSLIGFNYEGASDGLAPDGTEFDINSIKNPVVIEAALTSLNYSLNQVNNIRDAIVIEGIVPTEAVDQITVYKGAYEKNGSLEAARQMLDINYNYTQYKVTFNFSKTAFGDDDAALVLNTILECYSDYFYEQYGSCETVGNAALAIDYSDYDYLIAVDRYIETLDSLYSSIESLKNVDFRSTETGYTFSDLSNAINIAKAYNAEALTAYILDGSIVNDKQGLISYYEYQLAETKRYQSEAVSNVKAIQESIENYKKDQVIVYGELQEETATTYNTGSEEYDMLFDQLYEAQKVVSDYNYTIDNYEARLASVKKFASSKPDTDSVAYVEERIAELDSTVNELTQAINDSLKEYNKSIAFANAYSVLVPANVLSTSYVSMLISNIMTPLIIVECVVFFMYLVISIIHGFVTDSKMRKAQEAAEKAAEQQ